MSSNKPLQVSSDVHWVGVNDTDILLFEGLWHIPEGVSYNSYLVLGSEKTALIDSVHERKSDDHFKKINEFVDLSEINYVIINHMEPDHTSAIPRLLEKAPNAKLIFSPIAQTIFRKFYGVDPESVIIKGENAEISLGNKTLRFIQTPWLHWPETMSTYLVEDGILFCCDAFGAFKKLPENALLETEIDMNKHNICGCSKKYFASVFNGQREWVLKALEKIRKIDSDIKILAPSHGPVYVDSIKETFDLWENWSKGKYTKTLVVIYGSMYGMTAKCLEAIDQGIKEAGGTMISFNLSKDKDVDALTALVEAPAIIVGSPTYEHGIFPKVADFLNLLKVKGFSNRCAGVFGSFGWSGEATKKLEAELTALGFEVVEKPLRVYGSPTDDDLDLARQLGRIVAEKAFSKYDIT
jgi:flavorubredoxin